MADCPGETTLLALLEGRLEPAAAQRLELHLDECRACGTLLLALVRTRTASTAEPGDEPDLPRGTKVGRYTVRDRVGAGGMGVVYSAHDPELGRTVAIKLLRAGRARRPAAAARERIMREAQAMARLAHPNVITVYDVGAIGEGLFVAMELVEGGTLRERARELRGRDRRDAWREILKLARAAGEGLAAAHEAGIVHRDFKLDNVLVGADGRVRVCDFGLARAIAELDDDAPAALPGEAGPLETPLTQTGALVGTPVYMAPEQLDGQRGDERGDIFAFSVALHEALSGELPFAGKNLAELHANMLARRVRELTGANVPRWLRAALLRGMQPNPAERPANMRAMLDVLQPPPRRWAWALAAAAAALATAGGIAIANQRHADGFAAHAPRRLTNEAGCQEFPAFSAHGEVVFEASAVGGSTGLFAVDVVTGKQRRLFADEVGPVMPATSHDGRQLAWLRPSEGKLVTVVAPLDGSSSPRVVAPSLRLRPSFSPDDRALWAGEQPTRYDLATLEPTRRLALPSADAYELVELHDGRVVVHAYNDNSSFLLYPRGEGAPKPLFSRPAAQALFLDSREDAMFVAPTLGSGLVRVPLDGSTPQEVAGEVQPTKGIVISAARDRAVWSRCSARSQFVRVTGDAAGGYRNTPTADATNDWVDQEAQALPGGGLVVTTWRSGPAELWRTREDGSSAVHIPTGDVAPNELAVSPDGRSVAFTPTGPGVYLVPADGSSAARKLSEINAGSPSFRRDGRALFVVTDDDGGTLEAMPLDGGPITPVATGVGEIARASKAADDVFFFSAGKLVRLELGDHRRTEIAVDLEGKVSLIAVSPDGARVAVASSEMIVEVEVATSTVLGRLHAPKTAVNGLTYDEKGLIASERSFSGNLWTADGTFP